MSLSYKVITLDDFNEFDEITINSDTIKYIRIDLPMNFECVININCDNLVKLIISDSDSIKLNLNNNMLEELICYYKVSDEQNDYELYRPMRYICNTYDNLFKNNCPIIIQNKFYLSEDDILNDIDEQYYIYENTRRWWTNVYDKNTKEFICCM